MRPFSVESMRRTSVRNNSEASARRKRNLETMQGCCDQKTAVEWARELRVSEKTAQDYARELGETCKRVPRAKTKATQSRRADSSQASMMAKWAARPIRAQGEGGSVTAAEQVTRALADGYRYPKEIAQRTGRTLRAVQQTITRLERARAIERDGFGYQLTTAALEVFRAEHRGAA